VVDLEAGNLAQAAASFRRAAKARADFPAAYRGMARVLEKEGKLNEAQQAYAMALRASRGGAAILRPTGAPRPTSIAAVERRITPDPQARRLHAALAGVTDLPPPAQVCADAVAALFDRYAESFDQHLRGALGYRVPELIADAVAAHVPDGRRLDVLDLGCGTGLCGALLRPVAATLRGIDLSPAMIDKARARGVYDDLLVGDLLDALRQNRCAVDLLTAADVLAYVGDLAPVLEAAAVSLRPDGLFVFTVEATDVDRFRLRKKTQRYAHSEAYLRHVTGIYGFELRTLAPTTLRLEAGAPVNGFLVVLSAP
jgi:predicted TPR repeat methyltransferase